MSWTPRVGDVIYTAGESKKEDVWDDTELIEHWEVAMAEYRAMQGHSNDAPPFSTSYNNKAAEERQQPKKRLRVEKNGETSANSAGAPKTSNAVLETQNQNEMEQNGIVQYTIRACLCHGITPDITLVIIRDSPDSILCIEHESALGSKETDFVLEPFKMHPPLAEHKHQGCLEAIAALDECHRAGFMNRFSGACNDTKNKLDQCLKEEFLAVREENKGKARAKRAKLEKIWKEMEEPPVAPSNKS